MTNESPALDALILLVVKASEHCPAELASHLIDAMDTVEAECDSLQSALSVLKTERDLLKVESNNNKLAWAHAAREYEALEEERDRYQAERDALRGW